MPTCVCTVLLHPDGGTTDARRECTTVGASEGRDVDVCMLADFMGFVALGALLAEDLVDFADRLADVALDDLAANDLPDDLLELLLSLDLLVVEGSARLLQGVDGVPER